MATFELVKDPKILLPLLQSRHPHSCFIHNQVKRCEHFLENLTFYTLGTEVNSNTWVVSVFRRDMVDRNLVISAPSAIVSGKEEISQDVKESFSSGGIIPWDEGAIFGALEKPVSAMIHDISANIKGKPTSVHPCFLYYMEKEDAMKLDTSHDSDLELRSLEPDEGSEFIMSTWTYAREALRNVFKTFVKGYASAGVFLDGKCISGVITREVGMIAALYTLKEHRKRGLGKLTMNHMFKETAKMGCIPCCTAEISNTRAVTFNLSLGVKTSSVVDWLDVHKLNVD